MRISARAVPTAGRPRLAWAVGLVVVAACIAPPQPGEWGSVAELDAMMREGGAEPIGAEVAEGAGGGLEDAPLPLDDAGQGVTPPEVEPWEEEVIDEDPYILFGERIIVREVDGVVYVTKPYTLPTGRPQRITTLMQALEPFPHRVRPLPNPETGEAPPLDPGLVEYQILPGFDDEFFVNFDAFDSQAVPPANLILSDVFVITATPSLLVEFEDFLDRFAGGGVPQIELEAKVIEIVEEDTSDIGGTLRFLFDDRNFVQGAKAILPQFEDTASNTILNLGAVQDGVTFDGIIKAIEGWQNVQVDSRPKTVVRAGGVARIETVVEVPVLQAKSLESSIATFTFEYKRVGTELWISPRVVGSNTLALDVRVVASQRVGFETVEGAGEDGGAIEVPIIAYRTAKTVVHLKPGQTLIMGGLSQERDLDVVSKVPILGDIPLLGFFFRSTAKRTERQTVLFQISPRIIQNSDLQSDF